MSNDTIILSGTPGSAFGDTLQIALGKTNDNTSVNVAHVANFANPHKVTLAQLGAAPLNSPAFTGFPTAPQPALNDLSAALATTAYVKNQGYLTANQSITLTGDASGSGTTAISLTLASTGVSAGTYSTVSVDAKGRVLIGTNPLTTITANGDINATGSFVVGGAATLSLLLPLVGTQGTYNQVTTDSKGRVTSGTAVAYITTNQVVTVTGDASGSGSTMIALSLAPTGIGGGTFSSITVDAKGRATAGTNPSTSLTASGDASGTASFLVGGTAALALTLAAVGTAGTYNSVVVDAKGRVTSGTATAYLTANQPVTISGDASGSGSTAIALTLATVAAPGTYNSVVVDAKGRVTTGTFLSYAFSNQPIAISGDATGSGTTSIVLTLAASGVAAGTYTRVAVDTKGRVTSGGSLLSADVTTALGYTPVSTALVGAVSGLATLDSSGHLTLAQVPASLVGGVNFQGLWNASTNQPPLTSGTGTKGFLYRVSVAGGTTLDSISTWYVGDDAVFDGSVWSKMDGLASEVLSVAGRTGPVVLAVSDISGAAPLASPAFTGMPTAPTQATADTSTALATTAFVHAQGYVTGNQPIAISGDASGTGTTAVVLTLAAVGTAGTFTQVVTDGKGRVTSGSAVAFLTANQPVTISGDASGSGTTAISLTLAATGVGPGTYSTVSVDSKGRVLAGANPQTTVTATGDVSGAGSFLVGAALALSLLLPAVGTGGTFTQVVADPKGRVTAGSNPQTTLALSGDATASGSFLVGSGATLAVALAPVGTAGTYNVVSTDSKGRVTGGSSVAYLTANQTITASGDASGTGTTSLVLTLAAVGAAGTYNSVSVDTKGRVVAGTSLAYLLANQNVAITGDASGSGSTAITLTLAASGVVAGTYSTVVVDAKGRATAGSNPISTVTASGDATGSASFPVGGTGVLALTLAAVGAAGTYSQVATDAKGRVTSGANPMTSLTASGDATGAGSFVVGGTGALALTLASVGTAGTYSQVTSDAKGRVVSGSNPATALSLTGDASASGSFVVGGAASLAVTLVSIGLAGTYNQVTTDAKGRVITGTSQAYLTANQPVTISGDATGTGSTAIVLTLASSGVVAGTYSVLAVDAKGRATAGSNPSSTITATGDATGTAGFLLGGTAALALTLAAVGAAGTYTQVVVDTKGRVTSGSAVAFLTSNQAITISGDASGTGTTGITLALAPVGTAGTYSQVATDAKGRVISGSSPASTVTISGDASGSASSVVGGTAAITLALAAVGTAGTYVKVVVDAKGRVVASVALALADITTALGYTPANIASPAFSGTPTAPTPAQFDISTKLVTTAFVKQGGFELNAVGSVSASATLASSVLGGAWLISGNTAAITLTLPLAASVPAGSVVVISNSSTFVSTVVPQGTDTLPAIVALSQYEKVGLYNDGTSVWRPLFHSNYVNGNQNVANNLAVGGTSTLTGSVTANSALTVVGSTSLTLASATTPALADSSTSLATTAYVRGQSYLTANQGIAITGDATGTGSTAIALTLAATGVVAGTYSTLAVDAKGRALLGSNPSSTITVSGDATGTASSTVGGTAALPLTLAASGVSAGTYALATVVVDAKGRVTSASAGSVAETITASGDATGTATITSANGNFGLPLTLAAVGAAGTYNQVTTDAKGRVVAGASIAYLTTNQSLTISGDATGTGNTAISLTLAASGITAGTYSTVVVDAKGRATGGWNAATTLSATGDATGTTSFIGGGDPALALTLAASGVAAGTYSQVVVDTKGRVTSGVVMPGRSYDLYAANFDSPNTTDWKVNALAAATSDPTNTALTVRSFSNTVEQGVGFNLAIPTGVSQATFRYRIRSATAPSAASTATFNLYSRALPNGAAMGSWSAATALAAVTVPTNAFYIAAVQTIPLATLGWSVGNSYQAEFTRATGGVAFAVYLQQLTVELW